MTLPWLEIQDIERPSRSEKVQGIKTGWMQIWALSDSLNTVRQDTDYNFDHSTINTHPARV